jgi:hypothetical protein
MNKLQKIIAQCKTPQLFPSSSSKYHLAREGLKRGFLTHSQGIGFLATEKGLEYAQAKILPNQYKNEKLIKILTEAFKPDGYTATEEYGRSVYYAKKCGWITYREGNQAKYYVITQKGKEKLKVLTEG